jgi:hypothetical protein
LSAQITHCARCAMHEQSTLEGQTGVVNSASMRRSLIQSNKVEKVGGGTRPSKHKNVFTQKGGRTCHALGLYWTGVGNRHDELKECG